PIAGSSRGPSGAHRARCAPCRVGSRAAPRTWSCRRRSSRSPPRAPGVRARSTCAASSWRGLERRGPRALVKQELPPGCLALPHRGAQRVPLERAGGRPLRGLVREERDAVAEQLEVEVLGVNPGWLEIAEQPLEDLASRIGPARATVLGEARVE